MARSEKARVSVDAWESGKLGRDEQFVKTAESVEEAALDEALELKLISIRLPKKLINQLKLVGHFNGVGYQPLIRDVLGRFAKSELLQILRQQSEIAKKGPSSKIKKVA